MNNYNESYNKNVNIAISRKLRYKQFMSTKEKANGFNIGEIIQELDAWRKQRDQDNYQSFNQERLDHLLPAGEYATIDELRDAYGRYLESEKKTLILNNVNRIDTKEDLHAYIKKELNHQNKINNIRFYRGHYKAKWNCQSTLLRAFHDFYKPQKPTTACIDIKYLHDFRAKHHLLWKNLLTGKDIEETFLETFQDMEGILNVRGMADKYHDAAEKYANYLKGQGTINAAKRELAAQHYGLPTSLIDFTSCLCVALFFAVENKEKQEGEEGINGYLSIIHFDTEDKVANIEIARGVSLDLRESEIQSKDSIPLYRENRAEWDMVDDSTELDECIGMHYIAPARWRSVENDRLIKQRGILLCMSKNYHCSVEQVCKYGARPSVPTLKCTLINKSLIPEIKAFLLKNGVTEEKLGLA